MTSRVPRIFLKTNVEKYACMKKCEQGIRSEALSAGGSFREEPSCPETAGFESGDVYLFHKRNSRCPPESSLWGMFDKRVGSSVYLESSTKNLRHFDMWHRLPERYRYCRHSTRSEFRDYVFNRAASEFFELPGCRRFGDRFDCPGRLSDREDFSCVWRGRRRGNVSAVCEMYARSTNAASDATVLKCRYVGML